MKDKIATIAQTSYFRYLLVGGSAFILDYGILLVSFYILDFTSTVSASLGYLTGFIFSFYFNREWAFAVEKKRKAHRQLVEYILLVIINYFVTVLTINILNKVVPVYILKPAVVAIITIWNYLLYKYVIFHEDKNE